jgi:hypothetical protein
MKRPIGDVPKFSEGPWQPWFAWYPVRLGRDLGRGVRGEPAKWAFLRWIWRRWAAGATGLAVYVDYAETPEITAAGLDADDWFTRTVKSEAAAGNRDALLTAARAETLLGQVDGGQHDRD